MSGIIDPVLPSGWTWQPLDSLATVLVSNVDKKSYEGELHVQLCNYTDVYYNDEITAGMDFMQATATPSQVLRFGVKAGDVVITKDSETSDDIGRPAYVPKDLKGVVYGYHLAIYTPFDLRYGKFIKYIFDSAWVRAQLHVRTPGVTRVGLNQDTLKNLNIPVPSPSLAVRIANFLDHETAEIDAFIADQERLIELLDERRAATIAHAVTKGLDPNAPMKDSGINWLGNVPEDWVVAPLKWISKLVTGTTPSTTVESHFTEDDDGFPWIRPEDIDESGQSTVASKKLSSTGRQMVRSLPPGTVLLVCIGATLGKVGITSYESSTNQQITAIYGKGIDCKYLFYTMQVAYPEVRLSATGTTLPILNSSRLGSIRVPLPSEKEQRIISTYLERETSAIDAAVCDAREAIALSKERRAALISAAVTGQLDVSQAHSRGAAAEMLEDEVRV